VHVSIGREEKLTEIELNMNSYTFQYCVVAMIERSGYWDTVIEEIHKVQFPELSMEVILILGVCILLRV
jgi:hypothetical protein